ncbi:MAG: hypothetical protein AAGF30_14865, partial [Pseudomonadota bacterium]
MRYFSISALAFTIATMLAGCQTTATGPSTSPVTTSDGFLRISTRDDMAPIIGRRLAFQGEDFVVINADGTLLGEFGGVVTAGTWEMVDGFWCRTLTAGPERALTNNPTDCQLFERNGDTLRGTRDRGQGTQFEYTI